MVLQQRDSGLSRRITIAMCIATKGENGERERQFVPTEERITVSIKIELRLGAVASRLLCMHMHMNMFLFRAFIESFFSPSYSSFHLTVLFLFFFLFSFPSLPYDDAGVEPNLPIR
jgi:hypothetical protein